MKTAAGRGAGEAMRGLAALLLVAVSCWVGAAASAGTRLTPVAPSSAPALELNDTSGRPHRLADYRGKVVLVNFWATWCEPCRDEMPSMRKLQERVDRSAAGKLAILAVNYGESAAKVGAFLKRMPLGFPVLLDAFGVASRAWKPGVLPASYLIGKDGRVRYRVIGEVDWAGAEAAAVIKRLLDEHAG